MDETESNEPEQQHEPHPISGSEALEGLGCLTEGCLGLLAINSAFVVIGVSLLHNLLGN